MRLNILYILIGLFCLMLFTHCSKSTTDTSFSKPVHSISNIVWRTKVVNRTYSKLDMEIYASAISDVNVTPCGDYVMVNPVVYSNAYDTLFYFGNFTMNNINYTFSNRTVTYFPQDSCKKYRNALLVLPGSSFYNAALCLNGYIRSMGSENYCLLSSFAQSDFPAGQTLKIYGGFFNKWQPQTAVQLDSIEESSTGTFRLLDAIDSLLQYFNNPAYTEDKYITVVSGTTNDSLSSHTLDQIVQKALLYKVKINFIATPGYDRATALMYDLTHRTGGFSHVYGYYNANTVLLSLDKILQKNIGYYKVSVRLNGAKAGTYCWYFSYIFRDFGNYFETFYVCE